MFNLFVQLKSQTNPVLSYDPEFMDGETEAQGSQLTCQQGARPRFKTQVASCQGPHSLFFFNLLLTALGLCCCMLAFSSCGKWATLPCSMWAPHCAGFSCCGAQALGMWAAIAATHGLSITAYKFQSPDLVVVICRLSCSQKWDLPVLGMEPVSLALQGVFLTTGAPGKSPGVFKLLILFHFQ